MSAGEADYYDELLKTYSPDKIELQPKIKLSKANIGYIPDFKFIEEGRVVFVDYKGFATDVFKIKLRLWKAYCKEELRIVKKVKGGFKITEIINGHSD